jgi:predicted hydrocarbon binding protein
VETQTVRKAGLIMGDGMVTGATTGDRLMVLPVKFWSDAKCFLEQAYGASIDLVLSRFAENIGTEYGEKMKKGGIGPAMALKALEEMASVGGWGSVKVGGDLESGKSLQVRVKNCAFCPVSREANGKCDFMAGVSIGVARTTYGKDYACDHVETEQTGEANCVLTLTQRPRQDSKSWRTSVYFPWMMDSR